MPSSIESSPAHGAAASRPSGPAQAARPPRPARVADAVRGSRFARAALAVLASGALFAAAIGLDWWWPGAWLAPIPVLLFAFASSPGWAAGAAFAAFLLGGSRMFTFLATLMPPAMVAVVAIVPSVAFAAAVLLARRLVRVASARTVAGSARGAASAGGRAAAWWSGALAALGFPAAWTAFGYLTSVTSPHGTAGNLAYSQVDFLPVLQLVSLAGIWGISFVVALAPAGLAAAWHLRRAHRRPGAGAAAAAAASAASAAASGTSAAAHGASAITPGPAMTARAALAVTVVLVVPALAFGWLRLAEPEPPTRMRVGLAAADATVRYFRTRRPEEALPVIEAYARRVGELASRGAQVVVLPEKFVGVTPAYAGQAAAILAAAARRYHVVVVAGFNHVGERPLRNVALVLGPDGRQLAEYDKARPLPGFEDGYLVGRTPALLALPAGTAGVAICKDMDFPGWLRAYTAAGRPGILLVPAWDFVRDRRLHARMAVARGVESGFALARAAQNGLVTASDDRGRILAEAASDPEALVVADLPLGPGQTFYSRHGDWLGQASILLLAAALGACFMRRRPDA
jgi:apolipoprotein N-acyltransferase